MIAHVPPEGEEWSSWCLSIALREAGCDVTGIAEWVELGNVPDICQRLGLVWHGEGEVEIAAGQPVIVLYETRLGYSHAEYFASPIPLDDETIRGVIEIPSHPGKQKAVNHGA